MATKMYDSSGVVHDTIPQVFKSNWHKSVPWVYSKGAWHRAYDIGDENMLANSRMLNGSDIYFYSDGSVIGNTPPCYTIYNNSPSTGFNAFMIYFNQDSEYSRGYMIRTIDSRVFFQTRLSIKAGNTYDASIWVKNNDTLLQHSGVLADIYVDGDNDPVITDYVTFSKRFEDNPQVGTERVRINSTFLAKRDCIIQFNYGIGVRYNTNGNFSFDSPQVTKSNISIGYQPTPHVITNESVILNSDSGFVYNGSIMTANKTHKVSGSVVLRQPTTSFMVVSKMVNGVKTGIGLDLRDNTFFVVTPTGSRYSVGLKRPLVTDVSTEISVWFDVSNGFAQNIRLYVNGEVYARITTPYLSINTGLDTVFGLNGGGSTVEQFEIFFDDNSYLFNISNNGTGKLVSSDGILTLNIVGDYTWWSTVAPNITTQPNLLYNAIIGDTVNITAEAVRDTSVEWRNSRGDVVGNTDTLSILVDEQLDGDIFYYAIFKNTYGQVITRSTRIVIGG